GWRLHGTRGGLIAGLLFVTPGAAVVLLLAIAYAAVGGVPLAQALFAGVQATVVVIVLEALLRLARRALRGVRAWIIAGAAFVALFALAVPFPVVVLAAGAWGFLAAGRGHGALPRPADRPRTAATVALWSALWLGPLAVLAVVEGGILTEIGVFFALLAVVTFGGAYAVLAWMAQAVVADKGWLTPAQMIDGLGLAESTPGPLILVTEFVGFLAAFAQGGLLLGIAGAAVTLWATFVPCFLWIFAFAPWLDRITAAPRLAGALAAIAAAVVGVILNLALWFALHVFFAGLEPVRFGPFRLLAPDPASLDLAAFGIAAGAAWLILGRHWPLPAVLALGGAAAVGLSWLGAPG
ncbi:MAG: chromate transporter, partial [Gemmobacter sp.]